MFKVGDKVQILDFRNIPPSSRDPGYNTEMLETIGSIHTIMGVYEIEEQVSLDNNFYVYSFSWIRLINDDVHRTEKLL